MKTLNLPTEEGIQLGTRLAEFASIEASKKPGIKERCQTCAFRSGTIPNGCPPTLMDALKCLIEGDVFMCHEETRPCSGYLLMKMDGKGKAPWEYSDEIKTE